MKSKVLLIAAALSSLSCCSTSEHQGTTQKAPAEEGAGNATPKKGQATLPAGKNKSPDHEPNGDDSSTQDWKASTTDANPHVKILVQGWGGQAFGGFAGYRQFLQKEGFPADRVFELSYPSTGSRNQIVAALAVEFERILAKFPDEKVDVVGYSLGTISAIYTVVERGYSARVRKYVSIAGVDHGQAEKPSACRFMRCTDFYDMLVPFNGPQITEFHSKHAEALAGIDKCALYSTADGMLNPVESGRYPDGKAADVPSMTHLTATKSQESFKAFKDVCYGGRLD